PVSTLCLTLVLFLCHAPASSDIYTLSLHDALPICPILTFALTNQRTDAGRVDNFAEKFAAENTDAVYLTFGGCALNKRHRCFRRSEEHTSELQSRFDLVCRLLLEKKKYRESQITRY